MEGKKRLYLHFLRRPVHFFEKPKSNALEPSTLGGVKLEITKLSTNNGTTSDVSLSFLVYKYF